MKSIRLTLILCGLIALSACANYSRIQVEDVKGKQITINDKGQVVAELEMKVNNPTWRRVKVKEVELLIYRNRKPFATLSNANKLMIPSRSNDYLPFPVVIRMQNLLAMVLTMGDTKIEDFEVEGQIKASAFPFCKTIAIERQSLSAFASEYGDVLTPILNVSKP